MKKLNLFIALLFVSSLCSAQNLISTCMGNGITGTNSEQNKWGWAYSGPGTAVTWSQANSASALRLRDLTNSALDPSGTYSGRESLIRWDGTYNFSNPGVGGIFSLGVGNGTNTTVSGIALTAGTTYTFSGYAEWVNNNNAPTFMVQFSKSQFTGGTCIGSISLTWNSTTSGVKYFPFSMTFTPATTGNYYLQFTQSGGLVNYNGGILGLANLSLSATGTVTKSASTISFGPSNYLSPAVPTATVTGSTGAVTYNFMGIGSTTYPASATAPTAAGTYVVTATVAEDANYVSASTAPFKFTITSTDFSTNYIVNGDFETSSFIYPTGGSGTSFSLYGWVFDYGTSFANETANFINGTQTLRMGGTGSGQIYQLVSVIPGNSYRLSYTARTLDAVGASGSGASTGTLWPLVYKGNSTLSADKIVGSSFSNASNTTVSMDFTVPSGVSLVRVNFFKDKNFLYLDDVSLKSVLTTTISVTGATSYTYTGSSQGPASATVSGSTGAVTYSYVGVSGTTYTASSTPPTAVGSYTCTATVAGDATYSSATSTPYAFTIDNATGVNPIQESIQINRINKTNFQIIGDNIRTISVMNLVGKQLYSQPVESTNTTINLNDLCSGVYIVEAILNNGRKIVSKQIIQ